MKNLKKDLIALLDEMGVPGAMVSIRSKTYPDLKLLYGYSKIETQEPMNFNLPFRIGSITKTFTGTMILQLYDEGKIHLEDSVESALLGVPNGENITIRQVGSMRSGLFNFSANQKFQQTLEENPFRIWLSSEMLIIGLLQPPDFLPGTDFNYSNTNSVVLACILERLNDSTYEEALQERMFRPLRLKDTKYTAFIEEPCVNGYVYEDGEYVNVTDHNDSWSWSAGEIVSTVEDMHTYLRRSVANHQTISDDAVKQQRYWQTSERVVGDGAFGVGDIVRRYGFQIMKLNNYIGHNGSLPGYNAYILYSLQTQTSVVIICNVQTSITGVGPANELAALIVSRLK